MCSTTGNNISVSEDIFKEKKKDSLAETLLPCDKYRRACYTFKYYCNQLYQCNAMITSDDSVIKLDLMCIIRLKFGL